MRSPSARLRAAALASPRRSHACERVAVGGAIRSYACVRPRSIYWLLGFIARARAGCSAFFMAALARVRGWHRVIARCCWCARTRAAGRFHLPHRTRARASVIYLAVGANAARSHACAWRSPEDKARSFACAQRFKGELYRSHARDAQRLLGSTRSHACGPRWPLRGVARTRARARGSHDRGN